MGRKGSSSKVCLSSERSLEREGVPQPIGIEHASLEEKTYVRLRALIMEHQLMPGQRIIVDDLAAAMGVSRTPVLNALKRLAQERVVELFARRGIYVREFTKTEMIRLFEVREVLEGLAARLAATRIDAATVVRLTDLFKEFDGPFTSQQIQEYVERDRAFHLKLIEVAGNDQLTSAVESVHMRYYIFQAGLVRPPSETLLEHRAILDGLRQRDPEASEMAMRLHIRRSLERLQHEAAAEDSEAPQSLAEG